ncbi:hypothetical protein ASF62_11875 [Leifsonia sp. Leaf325]|nr:tyrosine-type recombinase/integrase [Leifsonia sp. Leaf325]KQQ92547.1 hypothetical protein ASF62_11875 [Leifsonia sp. Leaf325]
MVEHYEPKHEARQHWPEVRDFVVASVLEYAPTSSRMARANMSVLARYAVWLVYTAGLALRRDVAFDENNAHRFIKSVLRHLSGDYSYRSELTIVNYAERLGRQPRREMLSPAPVTTARTYTDRELSALLSAVVTRPTAYSRCEGRALLALGAGAGLRASEMHRVRVGDVDREGSDVVVVVTGGTHPRRVPVRSDWVKVLNDCIGDRSADEYLAWENQARTESSLTRGIAERTGFGPNPDPLRLRATWLVNLLNASIPLNLLLAVSGYSSTTALQPFLNAMAPTDATAFRSALTGGVSR